MSSVYTILVFLSAFCFINGFITWIEPRLPLPGRRAPPGSPWPHPQVWISSHKRLSIDIQNFVFTSNARSCDIIDQGLWRYRNYAFPDSKGTKDASVPQLTGLGVEVEDKSCGYPKLGDDESYKIEVPDSGEAKITSKTVWGAIKGLETFSQLVYQDDKTRVYYINKTTIDDFPTFTYRGILLDTARHFQPMKVLKQNLDAMAFNKFNVFHWHLVDDQAFPFESKIFPNLTKLGAYSQKHIYTQKDMKDIIEYARLRGIRVMPEIDTPGHAYALGRAFPHLLTPCYGEGPDKPYTTNYPEHSEAETLYPIQNETYEFLRILFGEVRSLFPDDYMHLGMDEVYYACWKSNPHIKAFMEKNGMKDYNEIEQYYVRNAIKVVKDVGYKYMTWQDPVDNGVTMAPDTIVEIWKDKYLDPNLDYWEKYITPIAKKGYQMVLSACWYLNYIDYGQDWKKYYNCDPRGFPGTEEEKNLVIGGEACMWGEYVDGTNLIARLWPRASAVAERLWSHASLNNTDDASFRLDQHRCRMLR
ncbi:beta-hexosaminidase subunit alpha-like [Centruroides sculpturatus]|uniref:beta-hexosaminidase subunit alpha-like n=1 Tax=Centruroides sculpturatus TaxID=218467 RepID=UPI000C6ECC63|nr:beta-hexosaminidase subunit alpha-like [Centruroides sculpturatus]